MSHRETLVQQLDKKLKTCKSGLRCFMKDWAEQDSRNQKEMREQMEFIKDLEGQIADLKKGEMK